MQDRSVVCFPMFFFFCFCSQALRCFRAEEQPMRDQVPDGVPNPDFEERWLPRKVSMFAQGTENLE